MTNETDTLHERLSPVGSAPDTTDQTGESDGMALCLSGGGYRAMLFHVGALWRLYELELLQPMERISSVSGGSITAATLALAWPRLSFDPERIKADFVPLVVDPLRRLAGTTVDRGAITGGILLPGTIADHVAGAYRKALFGTRTLQDLPDTPRFVFNATNVQSGALWRFSKPYMRDWRVGEVKNPDVQIAVAVAASSAFPPMLSPLILELDPSAFTPGSGAELQTEPYTSRVVLTDGGVYDNLGVETSWKRCKTVLVSDGGGRMAPEPEPKEDWAQHAYRILDLVDNQVRSLRKRQVIGAFRDKTKAGCYWGIRTDIADYELGDKALPFPHADSMKLAETPTRLKALPDSLQKGLINWGYAVCDAAVRRHMPGTEGEAHFPY